MFILMTLTDFRLFSSFTTSKNLLWHTSFLLPVSSIFKHPLIMYPLSLLWEYPNHLNLQSLTFFPNRSIWAVPLLYTFLILSILVTPTWNLDSTASRLASYLFFFFGPPSPNHTKWQLSLTSCKYILPQITPDPRLPQLCQHFLLHLYYVLSIALNSWPQIFKHIPLHYLYFPCIFTVTKVKLLPDLIW